jgi:peptidoglycan/LPS O-acetylase OafA/YrhL
MKQERIVFANLLRGVGAIAVLLSHFVGVFWVMNPDITGLLGAPALKSLSSLDSLLLFISSHYMALGQFGVGVFFILSGLVIPYSLQQETRWGFLYRRALRIYPVYIVGFSIAIVAVYGLSVYTGSDFRISVYDILAHYGVITRAPLGVARVDGISWTLEVEIYFYLAMCLVGGRLQGLKLNGYFVLGVLIIAVACLTFRFQGYLPGVQVAVSLLFMLGMSHYAFLNNRLSAKELMIISLGVLVAMPALFFLVAPPASYTLHWVAGYELAVIVFQICFYYRNRIKSGRVLSHFADISYPLYVVHALFGYSIMYLCQVNGFGSYASIFAASLGAYLAAVIIHFSVEKPTLSLIRSGRRPA